MDSLQIDMDESFASISQGDSELDNASQNQWSPGSNIEAIADRLLGPTMQSKEPKDKSICVTKESNDKTKSVSPPNIRKPVITTATAKSMSYLDTYLNDEEGQFEPDYVDDYVSEEEAEIESTCSEIGSRDESLSPEVEGTCCEIGSGDNESLAKGQSSQGNDLESKSAQQQPATKLVSERRQNEEKGGEDKTDSAKTHSAKNMQKIVVTQSGGSNPTESVKQEERRTFVNRENDSKVYLVAFVSYTNSIEKVIQKYRIKMRTAEVEKGYLIKKAKDGTFRRYQIVNGADAKSDEIKMTRVGGIFPSNEDAEAFVCDQGIVENKSVPRTPCPGEKYLQKDSESTSRSLATSSRMKHPSSSDNLKPSNGSNEPTDSSISKRQHEKQKAQNESEHKSSPSKSINHTRSIKHTPSFVQQKTSIDSSNELTDSDVLNLELALIDAYVGSSDIDINDSTNYVDIGIIDRTNDLESDPEDPGANVSKQCDVHEEVCEDFDDEDDGTTDSVSYMKENRNKKKNGIMDKGNKSSKETVCDVELHLQNYIDDGTTFLESSIDCFSDSDVDDGTGNDQWTPSIKTQRTQVHKNKAIAQRAKALDRPTEVEIATSSTDDDGTGNDRSQPSQTQVHSEVHKKEKKVITVSQQVEQTNPHVRPNEQIVSMVKNVQTGAEDASDSNAKEQIKTIECSSNPIITTAKIQTDVKDALAKEDKKESNNVHQDSTEPNATNQIKKRSPGDTESTQPENAYKSDPVHTDDSGKEKEVSFDFTDLSSFQIQVSGDQKDRSVILKQKEPAVEKQNEDEPERTVSRTPITSSKVQLVVDQIISVVEPLKSAIPTKEQGTVSDPVESPERLLSQIIADVETRQRKPSGENISQDVSHGTNKEQIQTSQVIQVSDEKPGSGAQDDSTECDVATRGISRSSTSSVDIAPDQSPTRTQSNIGGQSEEVGQARELPLVSITLETPVSKSFETPTPPVSKTLTTPHISLSKSSETSTHRVSKTSDSPILNTSEAPKMPLAINTVLEVSKTSEMESVPVPLNTTLPVSIASAAQPVSTNPSSVIENRSCKTKPTRAQTTKTTEANPKQSSSSKGRFRLKRPSTNTTQSLSDKISSDPIKTEADKTSSDSKRQKCGGSLEHKEYLGKAPVTVHATRKSSLAKEAPAKKSSKMTLLAAKTSQGVAVVDRLLSLSKTKISCKENIDSNVQSNKTAVLSSKNSQTLNKIDVNERLKANEPKPKGTSNALLPKENEIGSKKIVRPQQSLDVNVPFMSKRQNNDKTDVSINSKTMSNEPPTRIPSVNDPSVAISTLKPNPNQTTGSVLRNDEERELHLHIPPPVLRMLDPTSAESAHIVSITKLPKASAASTQRQNTVELIQLRDTSTNAVYDSGIESNALDEEPKINIHMVEEHQPSAEKSVVLDVPTTWKKASKLSDIKSSKVANNGKVGKPSSGPRVQVVSPNVRKDLPPARPVNTVNTPYTVSTQLSGSAINTMSMPSRQGDVTPQSFITDVSSQPNGTDMNTVSRTTRPGDVAMLLSTGLSMAFGNTANTQSMTTRSVDVPVSVSYPMHNLPSNAVVKTEHEINTWPDHNDVNNQVNVRTGATTINNPLFSASPMDIAINTPITVSTHTTNIAANTVYPSSTLIPTQPPPIAVYHATQAQPNTVSINPNSPTQRLEHIALQTPNILESLQNIPQADAASLDSPDDVQITEFSAGRSQLDQSKVELPADSTPVRMISKTLKTIKMKQPDGTYKTFKVSLKHKSKSKKKKSEETTTISASKRRSNPATSGSGSEKAKKGKSGPLSDMEILSILRNAGIAEGSEQDVKPVINDRHLEEPTPAVIVVEENQSSDSVTILDHTGPSTSASLKKNSSENQRIKSKKVPTAEMTEMEIKKQRILRCFDVSLLNLTTRCGQRFVRAISETSNEPGFHETLCSTISDKAEIAVYFKKQLQAFMTGVRLEQIQAANKSVNVGRPLTLLCSKILLRVVQEHQWSRAAEMIKIIDKEQTIQLEEVTSGMSLSMRTALQATTFTDLGAYAEAIECLRAPGMNWLLSASDLDSGSSGSAELISVDDRPLRCSLVKHIIDHIISSYASNRKGGNVCTNTPPISRLGLALTLFMQLHNGSHEELQSIYEELLNIALSIEAIPEVLRLYDMSDPSHPSLDPTTKPSVTPYSSAPLDKNSQSFAPLDEASASLDKTSAAPLDGETLTHQSLKMPRRLFKEVAVVIGKHVHDSKEAYKRVPKLVNRGVEMGMYPRQELGLAVNTLVLRTNMSAGEMSMVLLAHLINMVKHLKNRQMNGSPIPPNACNLRIHLTQPSASATPRPLMMRRVTAQLMTVLKEFKPRLGYTEIKNQDNVSTCVLRDSDVRIAIETVWRDFVAVGTEKGSHPPWRVGQGNNRNVIVHQVKQDTSLSEKAQPWSSRSHNDSFGQANNPPLMVSTPNPALRQPKQPIPNRNKTLARDPNQVKYAQTHNQSRNAPNRPKAEFNQAECQFGDQINHQNQGRRYVQHGEIGLTDTRNVYCDSSVPKPPMTQTGFKRKSGDFQAPPRPKRQPTYTLSKQQEPYQNSYNQYEDQTINPQRAPDAPQGLINHLSRGQRNVMQTESRIHSQHTSTGFNEGPNTYFVDSSRPSATSQATTIHGLANVRAPHPSRHPSTSNPPTQQTMTLIDTPYGHPSADSFETMATENAMATGDHVAPVDPTALTADQQQCVLAVGEHTMLCVKTLIDEGSRVRDLAHCVGRLSFGFAEENIIGNQNVTLTIDLYNRLQAFILKNISNYCD